jgi:hypothetical protein
MESLPDASTVELGKGTPPDSRGSGCLGDSTASTVPRTFRFSFPPHIPYPYDDYELQIL